VLQLKVAQTCHKPDSELMWVLL